MNPDDDRPFSEAYCAVVDLGLALGAQPLHRHPACWECQVDEQWRVSMNGHRNPQKTTTGHEVPPFECLVEFNGFPAGLLSPFDGVIAAGAAANEDAFITAVKARTAATTAGV